MSTGLVIIAALVAGTLIVYSVLVALARLRVPLDRLADPTPIPGEEEEEETP